MIERRDVTYSVVDTAFPIPSLNYLWKQHYYAGLNICLNEPRVIIVHALPDIGAEQCKMDDLADICVRIRSMQLAC